MHRDDLGGVDDLDAGVVAAEALEFGFELRRVAGEEEGADLGELAKGERGAFDEFGRAFVVAHGVERDLHGRSSTVGGGMFKGKKNSRPRVSRGGWELFLSRAT